MSDNTEELRQSIDALDSTTGLLDRKIDLLIEKLGLVEGSLDSVAEMTETLIEKLK